MSFGGSVLAMIITLKNNARPRRKAFGYVEDKKTSIDTHHPLKFKTVSDEKLIDIKKKIRKESDKEERRYLYRTMAVLAFIGILLIGGTTLYFNDLREKNAAIHAKQEQQRVKARKDEIAFRQNNVGYFLTNGKHYLEEGDFYKARIEYSKAYLLDENNHEALRGFTASYINDCLQNDRGCLGAKRLLKTYYDTYGETEDFKELQAAYSEYHLHSTLTNAFFLLCIH